MKLLLRWLLKNLDIDFEVRLTDTHKVSIKIWVQNTVVFEIEKNLLPSR